MASMIALGTTTVIASPSINIVGTWKLTARLIQTTGVASATAVMVINYQSGSIFSGTFTVTGKPARIIQGAVSGEIPPRIFATVSAEPQNSGDIMTGYLTNVSGNFYRGFSFTDIHPQDYNGGAKTQSVASGTAVRQ